MSDCINNVIWNQSVGVILLDMLTPGGHAMSPSQRLQTCKTAMDGDIYLRITIFVCQMGVSYVELAIPICDDTWASH